MGLRNTVCPKMYAQAVKSKLSKGYQEKSIKNWCRFASRAYKTCRIYSCASIE